MSKITYIDGAKSIDLPQYRPEAWTWLSGGPDDGDEPVIKDYYRAVPWLFRGVGLRAGAVSAVPFDIVNESGDVIDTSADYQNALGWLPDPYKLFWLIDASIVLTGKSYLWNVSNDVKTENIKYLIPTSVTPDYHDRTGELEGFTRQTEAGEISVMLDDNKIIYIWHPDPYVENEEPTAWPAKAAMVSAQASFNIDEFISAYFKRGAVKPTIISVKGSPPPGEKERIETWFNKLMNGIRNAFKWRVFSAEGVEFQTIGEGLESLSNKTLTDEQRQGIAAALGVPQTKLFSSDAGGLGGGGVADQDNYTFYQETVLPDVNLIYRCLNDQLFGLYGLRIVERHERMDIFQEDERERSTALVNLATAFDKSPRAAKLSALVLGFELPEDAEKMLDELISESEQDKERQVMAEEIAIERAAEDEPEPQDIDLPAEPDEDEELRPLADPGIRALDVDLDKWQRKSIKRLNKGDGALCPFESEHISPVLNAAIYGALEVAETEEEVKAVFADCWKGYP